MISTAEIDTENPTFRITTAADIEDLLARFLPRRDVGEEEVILQLEQRHKQRQKAIESHARCQSDKNGIKRNKHNI